MNPTRSISSTDAKASLHELLGSLSSGAVEITRDGRAIAVLSSAQASSLPDSARIAALALRYSAGAVSWRQVSTEINISFGELLVEMARQELTLPRVTPQKRPAQTALLDAALSGKGRRQ